ncbi:M4 family metallopeptidase [Stackebrandtia nassauensis]|uniref:Neutral metalloproteinase n=1 Tax=Stackebrandtia nassauensis (strain DSM 44728 / CIP 108903 / NRRL B-16338 / NBRC 102104 / LLR-40K-21) TaxID=446470 RepID=D3Q4Y2_STANL|nr:M4 family metallopeptidase [Stackebrandtia nassauensis]ADD42162.1 peptidase M4 thermolysin [Stackebrandtia nassauensis DSM 44728]
MKRLIVAGSAAALVVAAGVVGATAYADPADTGSKAVAGAESYVKSNGDKLFIGSDDKVTRTGSSETLGLTFSTFEREYKGLKVVGGDFVVATNKSGDVAYARSAQSKTIDLKTVKPKISETKAEAVAGKKASDAKLVVLAWDTPTLAYVSTKKTTDKHGDPVVRDYYVDAATGDKIATSDRVFAGTGNTYYNGKGGTVDFGTKEGGDGFVMEDPNRPGVSCAEEGGEPYTKAEDTWGNGEGTDLETACVDAMYSVGQEWDMLDKWLQRKGIDGEGNGFPIFVGLDDVNAYWDGSSTHFGHSQDGERQATPMDVVGHEFGHGIFQTTPGGSDGGNETGGLNEAAGDIFGTLTEFYANQGTGDEFDPPDYLIGEEVGLVEAGKPIRDMVNPDNVGDPACWSEEIPNTEVHAAAGPADHWFHLLAEGTAQESPTCDSSTLEGIGVEKAGQIWMGAMMGKTSNWTYTQARTAALEFAATSDLYETCAEYDAAKKAFDAVSVPAESDPECSKG